VHHCSLYGFWLPILFCLWLTGSSALAYAGFVHYSNRSLAPKDRESLLTLVPAFQGRLLFAKLKSDMGVVLILLLINYWLVHLCFFAALASAVIDYFQPGLTCSVLPNWVCHGPVD